MGLINTYLKPILSIEKSLFNSTELNRLYYSIYSKFMTPGDSVVIRNCEYHYIDLGLYLGLNHNELFTIGVGFQLDTDSRKFFRVKYQDSNSDPVDVEVHRRWDGTETAESDPYVYYFNSSLYKILQYNPGTIGRVVHPTPESSWEFEPVINPLNTTLKDVCELNHKVLSYDLVCTLLEWMGVPDLHSHVIPNGLITDSIEYGNLVRVIGSTPDTSDSIPNGDLGEFPTDLINQLNDDLLELSQKLDSLSLAEIPSNGVREVIEYGDVADYVSLKTLVKVDTHEYTSDSSNNKLYALQNINHYSVDRLIKLGALLEINILYKLTDEVRNNEDNSLRKLLFVEYDKNDPKKDPVIHDIRMDGYHITYGDPNEYLYSELIYIKDSFIRLNDDFIVQITEDSIILYPQNPMIGEYYIKSCKILCTDDN